MEIEDAKEEKQVKAKSVKKKSSMKTPASNKKGRRKIVYSDDDDDDEDDDDAEDENENEDDNDNDKDDNEKNESEENDNNDEEGEDDKNNEENKRKKNKKGVMVTPSSVNVNTENRTIAPDESVSMTYTDEGKMNIFNANTFQDIQEKIQTNTKMD